MNDRLCPQKRRDLLLIPNCSPFQRRRKRVNRSKTVSISLSLSLELSILLLPPNELKRKENMKRLTPYGTF